MERLWWVVVPAWAVMLGSASPARSAGINLSWGDCGLTGTSNLVWACNANLSASATPQLFVVASFIPPDNPHAVVGIDAVFHWNNHQAVLSSWWQYGVQFIDSSTTGPPGCRSGSMAAQFDASRLASGGTNCFDYTGPSPSGSSRIFYGTANGITQDASSGYAKVHVTVPSGSATPLDSTVETYAPWLRIDKLKTIGTGSCAGCRDSTIIVLDSVTLYYDDNTAFTITQPLERNSITAGDLAAPPPPPPVPIIDSFSPTHGLHGTAVTILGKHFLQVTAVDFTSPNTGWVSAAYTVASDSVITTTVPGGFGTGPIMVVNGGGSDTSGTSFVSDEVSDGVPAAQLTPFTLGAIAVGASGRDLTVSLTLPRSAPATLELYDVNGRRLLIARLDALPAGEHTVRLASPRALHSGVFFVRLRQAERHCSRRFVTLE